MQAAPFRAALLALILAVLALPALAARVIDADGPTLSLELHQGRLVRLDRPAASVFIADPEVADVQVKSPQIIYVFGKKTGETSLFAVDDRDQVVVGMPVVVSHNLNRLGTVIRSALPDGGVRVDSVDGAVVMSGLVPSAAAAEEVRRIAAGFVPDDKQLINRLRVAGPNQINLRVRVAEVNREVVKRFGINWDALLTVGDFAFGIAQGLPTTGKLPFPGGPGGRSPIVRRANNANNLIGAVSSGGFDLNVVVDALENEGLLAILAEPNLTAMSGERASFLAGGEFPIPVPQDGDTVTITYKKFGVSLEFTPTILADGRINLNVKPEVSQLTSAGAITISGFTIPALATRRAETTIELGSGQSFAIAGLLSTNTNQEVDKFPGLGDLPVLGALFRSDVFRRGETELVILVTPYIVRPAQSPAQFALPTDGMIPVNDAERIFGRKGWAEMGGQPSDPAFLPGPAARAGLQATDLATRQRLAGPVGFILE